MTTTTKPPPDMVICEPKVFGTPDDAVSLETVLPDKFAHVRQAVEARFAAPNAGKVGPKGQMLCGICGKGYKHRKGAEHLCDKCNADNARTLAHSVKGLIANIEKLEQRVFAPAVERIYEIGKIYIALVPVTEGATIVGWKIAEMRTSGPGPNTGLMPVLFKAYHTARYVADELARARNNPALSGRIYEIQVGDLADSDWTEPELYQHVERMWMHFAGEEARLRPTAAVYRGPAGNVPDDVMTIAAHASAGPEQIKGASTTSRLRCRRCRGIFEMPAATYVKADPSRGLNLGAALPGAPIGAQRVPIPPAVFCVMCTPVALHTLAQAVLEIDRSMRILTDKPSGPSVPPESNPT